MSIVNNAGVHILSLIDKVECKRHKAPTGTPCFHIPKTNENGYFVGICNQRAVKAGANGKISENSYQQRVFNKKR